MRNGKALISFTYGIEFIHGKLTVAEEKGLDVILPDGPPGVGCPVIASIDGASAVLME